MKSYYKYLSLVGIVACTSALSAQFVADEFNAPTLGPQWTFHDSTPTGSVQGNTGTHLSLKAQEGADMYFFIDKYCYVEQDAPAGTNWEVVTKLDGFDPTEAGKQNDWNKSGIMIWQDNDHWFGVWAMGNNGDGGWRRAVEGSYNSDFVPNREAGWPEWGGDQALWDISADPVWLKVQKTSFGYFGYFSTDGTNWIEVNRQIRNSQNPTGGGYFTNEKIRLLQSGPGTNGTNDVALFDYIRTAPVTVPTAAPGTSDEFNAGTLDTSIWGIYHGVEPSTVAQSGGALRITPANFNDQWGGIDKAVRVYQALPGTGNYSITVKAGPTQLFNYQDWTGYGLFMWQDQNDYASIANVRTNTGGHMIQAVYQREDAIAWNVDEINIEAADLPAYLRITKMGSNYTASYSNDNITYTELPVGGHTYPAELQNPQAQLLGKKINDNGGPQMTAEFDWFHFDPAAGVDTWELY